MIFDLTEAEEKIHYHFQDVELVRRAFTHPSYVNEHAGSQSNQTLEFFGDSVLGFVVKEYLCRRCPVKDEGELTRIVQKIVSTDPLAHSILRIRLNEHLLLGVGEVKYRDHLPICEDLFEAVVAALYWDGGMAPAKKFILTMLAPEIEAALAGAEAERAAKNASVAPAAAKKAEEPAIVKERPAPAAAEEKPVKTASVRKLARAKVVKAKLSPAKADEKPGDKTASKALPAPVKADERPAAKHTVKDQVAPAKSDEKTSGAKAAPKAPPAPAKADEKPSGAKAAPKGQPAPAKAVAKKSTTSPAKGKTAPAKVDAKPVKAKALPAAKAESAVVASLEPAAKPSAAKPKKVNEIIAGRRKDAKSELSERLQKAGRRHEYVLASQEGPAHEPLFCMKLLVDGREIAEGTGPNKKSAEQKAAKLALKIIQ